uniref:Flotillin-1 n=1 Tax=Dugesia japonica TaxID=6161 RepID=A0A068CQN6_DUGJA|nr:flotillin-1 [Dugesia japonica]APU52171.1 flotillin-1 [Dugesia japonica]
MPFVISGPNEVLVVSGCCLGKPLMIIGGKKFVWSGFQTYQKLSLNVKTIVIVSPKIYTKLGVALTVTGVAQIKIEGRNRHMLLSACEQFLGKQDLEISNIVKETLEAHQRAIMGIMTVEEIYQDRKKFSEEVFRVASSDLMGMGISVVSYTIKDISDEQGYLKALGQTRTAQVIRDARIGEAEAIRDAEIKKARAQQAKMHSKLANDTAIAKADRDYKLQKAVFDREVHSAEAIAQMAYRLQEAKTNQMIMEETKEIDVIERQCKIRVQELEVLRVVKNLEATIKNEASAEKYRMEKLAEAEKIQIVNESEALSESIKLKGEAEAFAIETVGKADAAQMTMKAEAWKEYEKAAKIEMVLSMLPNMAAEIAQPLTNCQKITMVSNGDGEIGVSKLAGEVINVIKTLSDAVNKMSRDEMKTV